MRAVNSPAVQRTIYTRSIKRIYDIIPRCGRIFIFYFLYVPTDCAVGNIIAVSHETYFFTPTCERKCISRRKCLVDIYYYYFYDLLIHFFFFSNNFLLQLSSRGLFVVVQPERETITIPFKSFVFRCTLVKSHFCFQ